MIDTVERVRKSILREIRRRRAAHKKLIDSALRALLLKLAIKCIEDRAPMLGGEAIRQVATEKVAAILGDAHGGER